MSGKSRELVLDGPCRMGAGRPQGSLGESAHRWGKWGLAPFSDWHREVITGKKVRLCPKLSPKCLSPGIFWGQELRQSWQVKSPKDSAPAPLVHVSGKANCLGALSSKFQKVSETLFWEVGLWYVSSEQVGPFSGQRVLCWCPISVASLLHPGTSLQMGRNYSFIHSFKQYVSAAAAAKSLQSCPTLWDPIDGSPPGSPVRGILQARTREWVAISFSNAWKWKVKVKSLSCVWLLATPWTAAYQAPSSMGFSRQEYWSGVPVPSPSISLRSAYYSCHCPRPWANSGEPERPPPSWS